MLLWTLVLAARSWRQSMWNVLKRLFGIGAKPVDVWPPTAVVDERGAEVRFFDQPPWRIEWSALREVAVDVVVDPTGPYSEGFWTLKGRSEKEGFQVPVEIVAGSQALNARLFSLPGFDMDAYRRAREAEANSTPGYFVCWTLART